jgi:sugar lactone lactonase YvrE
MIVALLGSLIGGRVGSAQAEPAWTVLAAGLTVPGDFRSPYGVAVDGDGNIYVADSFNHRVQKLSPTGEPLALWGSEGSGRGQFRYPKGIAVDTEDSVYVAAGTLAIAFAPARSPAMYHAANPARMRGIG